VSYPELVEKVIVVAATAALTAQAIAFSEVQRQAIMADRYWQKGNYRPGEGPDAGLVIARMLSMITYQSEASPGALPGRVISSLPAATPTWASVSTWRATSTTRAMRC